jgi:HEAT repeat protein
MNDPIPAVRLEAAVATWALFHDATQAAPTLAGLLDGDLSWHAAYALGEMGPAAASAGAKLAKALEREKVPRVTRNLPSSALALGKIGPKTLPHLLPLLRSPDPAVQVAAILAAGMMGPSGRAAEPDLMGLLDSPNTVARHAAALALADIGAEGKRLIEGLAETLEAEDIYMRAEAVGHLRRLAPEREWAAAPE